MLLGSTKCPRLLLHNPFSGPSLVVLMAPLLIQKRFFLVHLLHSGLRWRMTEWWGVHSLVPLFWVPWWHLLLPVWQPHELDCYLWSLEWSWSGISPFSAWKALSAFLSKTAGPSCWSGLLPLTRLSVVLSLGRSPGSMDEYNWSSPGRRAFVPQSVVLEHWWAKPWRRHMYVHCSPWYVNWTGNNVIVK